MTYKYYNLEGLHTFANDIFRFDSENKRIAYFDKRLGSWLQYAHTHESLESFLIFYTCLPVASVMGLDEMSEDEVNKVIIQMELMK